MFSPTIPHPGYIGRFDTNQLPQGLGVDMHRNLKFVKSHSINKGSQGHLTTRCAQGGGDFTFILSNPHFALVYPGWGIVGLNIARYIELRPSS